MSSGDIDSNATWMLIQYLKVTIMLYKLYLETCFTWLA